MTTAIPQVYRVPTERQEMIRAALREPHDRHPDTDTACAFVVELFLVCCTILQSDEIPLKPVVTIESERLAVLTVTGIPLLSLVACDRVMTTRAANCVRDVRCVTHNAIDQKRLNIGEVRIEFWRHDVPTNERLKIHYSPTTFRELTATPNWDAEELAIRDATDRENLLTVMRMVANMNETMPVGILTAIDLVYSTNFQDISTTSSATSSAKRKRGVDSDERSNNKQRKGATAAADDTTSPHIGYCLVFQHPVVLPNVSAAFMNHVVTKVPTVKNWFMLFANTKPCDDDATEVVRRNEALAIVMRRWNVPEDEFAQFSVTGSKWLAQRLATTL